MPFLASCCCVVPPPCRVCAGVTDGCRPDTPPGGTVLALKQNGAVLASYTLGAAETSHCFTGLAYGTYAVAVTPPNPRYATPADLTATLYLNDGSGTVTLTGDGSGTWTGTCTRVADHDCTGAANVSVPVKWQVTCQQNPLGWVATPFIQACRVSYDPYDPYEYTYDYPGGYLAWESPWFGAPALLTPGPTCPPAAVSASGSTDLPVYYGNPPYGPDTGLGHVYGIRPPDASHAGYYCRISVTLSS